MNLAVDLVAVGILAVVAGGSDDDDAGVNELTGGAADRVILVSIDGSAAEAQVDDADAVLVLVERIAGADGLVRISRAENPVQGVEDGRRAAHPLGVQDAQ